jgi:hypothetical protein
MNNYDTPCRVTAETNAYELKSFYEKEMTDADIEDAIDLLVESFVENKEVWDENHEYKSPLIQNIIELCANKEYDYSEIGFLVKEMIHDSAYMYAENLVKSNPEKYVKMQDESDDYNDN